MYSGILDRKLSFMLFLISFYGIFGKMRNIAFHGGVYSIDKVILDIRTTKNFMQIKFKYSDIPEA